MKLEALVSKHYGKLNPNDLIIWQYICQHKARSVTMTIEAMAEECSMSRSTVMRFAQKIGLSGYSELKACLRWELDEWMETPENLSQLVRESNIKAIRYFGEQNYERICRRLYESKRIFTYGTGQAQKSVCGEFQRMMLSLNILVHDIPGEGELRKVARMLGENDTILIVSKSGESIFLKNIMIQLCSQGVFSVSLTRYGNNTLAKMSTENLFVEIEEIAVLENTNFESMTLMFLILETVFTRFAEYRIKEMQGRRHTLPVCSFSLPE